ncbi:SDR family NAD(P)-dependent oxidoreductase [Pseudonocardia sp. H11422]|uniref:SDR family NAD(P)-dependent oxidoreductase n=1 Tax=Pseudonocardia sp. H11422 TaxID=2835866 RepID=UPI001BDCA1CB|nr:SDR family oxidoreductase [Pseudonocardia sp. H11422]
MSPHRSRTGPASSSPGAPRSAVVTGGGRGIGEAIATELVRRGYRVLVTDVDGATAAATAQRIGAAGGVGYDVTDEHAAHDVAKQARELAPLGAWVNNAGVGFDGTLSELSSEHVRALVDVNVMGVVWGCRAAVAAFREQAAAGTVGGDIGITASLSALGPVPGLSLYAATKAAVLSLAAAQHSELRAEGIRVHAICPDGVNTELLRSMADDGQAKALVRSGVLVAPEQVARALADMFGTQRVYRTLPGWRGAIMRSTALAPGPMLRLEPVMRAWGRRRARSLR